ncbi:MAG: DUF2130 domain-containing protein [Candidatus Hydrogenedentales bacterium]|jgi:hypothetical protein
MPDQKVTCPNCGTQFAVGDALTDSIRAQMKSELEAEVAQKHEEATKRLNKAKELETSVKEREQAIEDTVAERLDEARKKVKADERKRAEREFTHQLEDLQEQIEEGNKKLGEANKREKKFLQRERELQEKEKSIDLEIERRLTDSMKQLRQDAEKKAEEAQQLKIREKDNLINGLQDQIRNLQKRIEQSSQESQGEALEGQLQDTLAGMFPFDAFEEVKKGARGADIVQIVRDRQGRTCGKILWEAKNAKNFQNSWVSKLKRDQMEAGAALAVLMTMALPAQIKQFGQIEDGGVWITDYASAVGLCAALREQLIRVTREKMMVEHRETAKDILFEYVTGQEFNLRVRTIVDTYIQMQQDLESEKRALQRLWKKREKQIAMVLDSIVGMRGELEGMVGTLAALPGTDSLSLEHLAEDEDPF